MPFAPNGRGVFARVTMMVFFGVFALVGLFLVVVHGPIAYTATLFGYSVRNEALVVVSVFGLLSVRSFGWWRGLLMVGFFDAGVELTFNALYALTCPSSLAFDVAQNWRWPVYACIWIGLLVLVLLVVRPRFLWKAPTTLAWAAWQCVWVVAGVPIIAPYCHGVLSYVPGNWPWELVDGFSDFMFLWRSFRPRVPPK